jgi:DNA-binding response OmpR family regulator
MKVAIHILDDDRRAATCSPQTLSGAKLDLERGAENEELMTNSNGIDSPLQESTTPALPRVLLVQAGGLGQSGLHRALERSGFIVVSTSTVREAVILLTTGEFAALVCDLQIPDPGDGFTLVNAMRHFHPTAITMIMSKYPALKESVSALLPQADEILVTPIPPDEIITVLKNRLRQPKRPKPMAFEPIATVLERHSSRTISDWLSRVNSNKNLVHIPLNDKDRTGHLPTLLRELVERLRTPHLDEGKAKVSLAAVAHGKARKQQGYSAAMLVEESRILQVCIFKCLRSNLSALDLALVLTDVMTIADEVDSQLSQTMASYSASAALKKERQSLEYVS